MSYEATYNTRINTRIASDALKNIGKNFLQMAEGIRTGSAKCTVAMDKLMNKENGSLLDIRELKKNFEYKCNLTLKNNPHIGPSQAKIQTINSIPELDNLAGLTQNYKTLITNPELTKGREGKLKVNTIVEESFSLIEKSIVDVQTVLITKAITKCNWTIVDSASENSAQTVVAQNREGSVLALNITVDNISLDIAGLCDSSCVDHAKKLVTELDSVGLKASLTNELKHNKPSGGILLGESKHADKIINKVKRRKRQTSTITIPIKANVSKSGQLNQKIKNKLKDL